MSSMTPNQENRPTNGVGAIEKPVSSRANEPAKTATTGQGPEQEDKPTAASRVAVLVLGMHRSGTSAITRVINLLGADLAVDLLPANDGNEAGYWESADAWQLNDEILASAGSRWDDWLRHDPASVPALFGKAFKARALGLLERDFEDSPLFVLKDPRICRLLPFWLDVLREFGAEPACVLPIRNPLEVAASLTKRNGFIPAKSHMLWLRYVLDAEYGSRGLNRAFVSYDGLLDDWRNAVRELADELGIAWPGFSSTSESEIDRFLEHRHRHHAVDDAGTPNHPGLDMWVKETYSAFSALQADRESEDTLCRLDRVRDGFDRASDALGALVRSEEMARTELVNSVAARDARIDSLQRELKFEQGQNDSLQRELKFEQGQKLRILGLKNQLLHRIDSIQASATWQLARPLRSAEFRWPRLVRGVAAVPKLAWWTLTFRLRHHLSVRRLARELLNTGQFDRAWYVENNPDVVLSGNNPVLHWLDVGWTEGRDPNPRFDTDWYLEQYPEVAQSGMNPLTHYLERGVAEGRQPSPAVDIAVQSPTDPDSDKLRGYSSAPDFSGTTAASQRVAVVSGEPGFQGHLYRVEHCADGLTRAGSETFCLTVEELPGRLSDLSGVDVLVIWRALWDTRVAGAVDAVRHAGGKVVFDVDDLMFDPDLARSELIDGIRTQGLTEKAVRAHYRQVQKTMEQADFCTCPTEALASALRQFGKQTFVLPNGFDGQTVAMSRTAAIEWRNGPDDGLVRIGYAAGTRTHQKDFGLAANAVARVLQSHPNCRLVLFSRGEGPPFSATTLDICEFPAFAEVKDQIEVRRVVPIRDLPAELARFDINIAPLEVGNPFCEAKSELKYFEAALVGVPTVASPTQPFRSTIRNGSTGFLADGEDEWFDSLKRLVEDAELRRRVGRNALHDVLWRYGPERRADFLRFILGQVAGRQPFAARGFESELYRRQKPPGPIPEVPDFDVVFLEEKPPVADVAVIMPVYNYAHYVVEALESVKAQSLPGIELIVVDDRSTDDSLAVVRRWMEENKDRFQRVALLQNKKNSFLGLARNAAFAFAEAPLVLPLDPDNKLLPRCAETCANALEGSGAAMAYPHIQQFGDATGMMGTLPWSPSRLVMGNYIDAMAMLRKSAWAAIGGYQNLFGWEDFDLWCKFAENGMWGMQIPEVLAQYRVHGKSMLRTHTHVEENEKRLYEDVYRRHPWLDIPAVDEGFRMPESFPDTATPGTRVVASPSIRANVDTAEPLSLSDSKVDSVPSPEEYVDTLETRAPKDVVVVTGWSPVDNRKTSGQSAPMDRLLPRPHDRARLEALLPMLRCPVSAESLVVSADGSTLVSEGGAQQWRVQDGRPLLFPAMSDVARHSESHVSNALCGRAVELIEDTEGMVLNLSAGGSTTWYPHVVEAEAGIFRNTDLVADAHVLPFKDESFDLVIAMNAFEHYASPETVTGEIHRVLRPGGRVFIHTAFLQPLHEAPYHFYNCTKFGLLRWFAAFHTLDLGVSANFSPGYSVSWLLSETERALRESASPRVAAAFSKSRVGSLVHYWRDPEARKGEVWRALSDLPQDVQERVAAGFEFLGQKDR